MRTREKIFVSYSHKDKKLFEEFKTMIAPAIQRGSVDLWDDQTIPPGAKWEDEIQKALASASVAVLVVSQNFLASRFISKDELPPLLKAAREEGVTIFWIYLSSCLYQRTEIASYQAAHDISQPLDCLSKARRQAVLSEICAKLIAVAQPSTLHPQLVSDNSQMPISSRSPGDTYLECCLLLVEALESASTAAGGGGPSTTLHRRLTLAKEWLKKSKELLPDSRNRFSSQLAAALQKLAENTLPWLISETRLVLPEAGDADKKRGSNEYFEQVRQDAYRLQQEIGRQLAGSPEFTKLQSSDQKWPVLGFRDEDDYRAFLYPTIERLLRSPDPMQRDLFSKLLTMTEFTPGQLIAQGYRKDIVMDSLNALLSPKWAEWTDLSSLGDGAKGRITDVGKRLLSQSLGQNNRP
jgi:hypothetical protein